MKNKEIISNFNGINAIVKSTREEKKEYPVKFSYALTRNAKLLEPLVKTFEEEQNKLLDIYNVKNEDDEPAYKTTGKIDIPKEKVKEWNVKIEELLNIEVEFKAHCVNVEDLPKEVEPSILLMADFMISE